MIELKSDKLVISFPELPLHPALTIDFQRTLRIPDDGKDYPLPPGLGTFPLRHIDDYAQSLPESRLKRGGVLLPMWQSEGMWINFQAHYLTDRRAAYRFAIKVATGKINAITGETWRQGLSRNPQDYLVAPTQPWLDGFYVEKGIIRQFVAMPLGEGYSAEEQLTGEAEFGGLQMEVVPMRPEAFEEHFPVGQRAKRGAYTGNGFEDAGGMGLAPGGRMLQEIYEDPYSIDDWDTKHVSRCFVHLVNSITWQTVTGERPPSQPLTARQCTEAGYPWFDYYNSEMKVLAGAKLLATLKSVKEKREEKRAEPLPENQTVHITNIVSLRPGLQSDQVRESDIMV